MVPTCAKHVLTKHLTAFSCLGCFLSPGIVLVIWCYDESFLINAQYLYCRNYGMKQSIFCLCLKWTRWVEWCYWIMTLVILNGHQFIYLQSCFPEFFFSYCTRITCDYSIANSKICLAKEAFKTTSRRPW